MCLSTDMRASSSGDVWSRVCFKTAKVAQHGLHVVPKGSTCHSYTITGLSLRMFLHRNLSRGLSSGSRWIWWNIPLISLVTATVCSLNQSNTPRRVEERVGPARDSHWKCDPQTEMSNCTPLCFFYYSKPYGLVCTKTHVTGLRLLV